MTKQVDKIPITEPTPQNRRISWWIENTLVRGVLRIVNVSSNTLKQIFSFAITDFIESFESELIPFVSPFANEILNKPGIPDWIKRPIRTALTGQSQAGIIILITLAGVVAIALGMGAVEPASAILKYHFNRLLRPYLFSPELLIELWKRDIITSSQLTSFLEMNGVSSSGITALKGMATPLYDDNVLTQLFFKKEVGQTFVHQQLVKRGLNAQQREHWFKVRELIPSSGELISIAVREGFNDDIARQFGYDDDYPSVAAEYAEKTGLDQKFFKAQWRAHWALPGLVQVREMYHRNIIDENTLQTYLRAADIPSFWRGAITSWMSRVVTRVDARRMYSLGIWNEKRIFQHYQELGYSDNDAEDMTLWTSVEYMSETRELTKTDILSMYKDGILNESEATTFLLSLDYKPQGIMLLLTHQLLKRNEQYERTVIRNIQRLYVSGLYSRTDVFQKMGKLDTPTDVVIQSLEVWDLEKELAVRIPSITQLRDMVLMDVITLNQFIEQMKNKKYDEMYIYWYIDLWELRD